jgi:hypothetical protein
MKTLKPKVPYGNKVVKLILIFFFERGQAEFSSGKRRPPARAVTTAPAERAIIYPKRK